MQGQQQQQQHTGSRNSSSRNSRRLGLQQQQAQQYNEDDNDEFDDTTEGPLTDVGLLDWFLANSNNDNDDNDIDASASSPFVRSSSSSSSSSSSLLEPLPPVSIGPSLYQQEGDDSVGQGLFSTRNIQKDEVLLRIPESCVISLQNAWYDEGLGDVFCYLTEEGGDGGAMVALAGFVARQMIMMTTTTTTQGSTKSHWYPYLSHILSQVLPPPTAAAQRLKQRLQGQQQQQREEQKEQEQQVSLHLSEQEDVPYGHVLWWSDHQVESWLKGSNVYDSVMTLRNDTFSAMEILWQVMQTTTTTTTTTSTSTSSTDSTTDQQLQEQQLQEPPFIGSLSSKEDWEVYMTAAYVAILSRAFEDPEMKEDGGRGGRSSGIGIGGGTKLIPVLDMAQHAEGNMANMYHSTNLQTGDIVVQAKYDIPAGQELTMEYAHHLLPHEYFPLYGFVPGEEESCTKLLQRKSRIFFP